MRCLLDIIEAAFSCSYACLIEAEIFANDNALSRTLSTEIGNLANLRK